MDWRNSHYSIFNRCNILDEGIGETQMKKPTPENAVKAEVKKYLHLTGWFVFPILQGLGAYRGISDMIAIKNGLVLFVECKSKRGSLSGDQMRFREHVRWNGGHYVVARGYEDVKDYVEKVWNDEHERSVG